MDPLDSARNREGWLRGSEKNIASLAKSPRLQSSKPLACKFRSVTGTPYNPSLNAPPTTMSLEKSKSTVLVVKHAGILPYGRLMTLWLKSTNHGHGESWSRAAQLTSRRSRARRVRTSPSMEACGRRAVHDRAL